MAEDSGDMRRVPTPRRYFLLARQNAWDEGVAAVWRAKQEAQPGTALPESFPARAALAAAGYTTVEDLDGANESELSGAGLSTREARDVISAAKALLF